MAEKYSGLPFIDACGKDVFETSDSVEEKKLGTVSDLNSEAVEHYKINQNDAYNAFKDRYVDSSGIDFSEKIGPKRQTGYDTRTVYEIIGEAVAKETPQQKYQRLQHELQQLSEEVTQISDSVESADKEARVSPVVLAKEVVQLQKQLQNLHLEKVLGTECLSGDVGPQNSWTRHIAEQLETFKSRDSTKSSNDSDQVTYELYCRPEHSKFTQTSKISEFERRLRSLEDLIGKDAQKMAGIIAEPENASPSLMDTVNIIRTKMSLFDPTNIDVIDSRLQGLLQHILQIGAKKDAVENAEKEKKIAEIHEMMLKWDGVAEVVPELASRFQALKALHEQASSFAQTLAHLEITEGQIKNQLDTQSGLLVKLEDSFVKNMAAIQANCDSIDGRVNGLLEKMG